MRRKNLGLKVAALAVTGTIAVSPMTVRADEGTASTAVLAPAGAAAVVGTASGTGTTTASGAASTTAAPAASAASTTTPAAGTATTTATTTAAATTTATPAAPVTVSEPAADPATTAPNNGVIWVSYALLKAKKDFPLAAANAPGIIFGLITGITAIL